MEITKDNYFEIRYNEDTSTLELPKAKSSFLKNHKIIISLAVIFFTITLTNLYLVYKFFEVLSGM